MITPSDLMTARARLEDEEKWLQSAWLSRRDLYHLHSQARGLAGALGRFAEAVERYPFIDVLHEPPTLCGEWPDQHQGGQTIRITTARLRRKWPHHVALPADKGRGLTNTLSVALRPFYMRRDGIDFVVFCFANPEDAEAFADRFGGERLPVAPR
jgi:hypothetical protein